MKEPCDCGALDCPHCGDKDYIDSAVCETCPFFEECTEPGCPSKDCLYISDMIEKSIDDPDDGSW
jgi:hypothetical protein